MCGFYFYLKAKELFESVTETVDSEGFLKTIFIHNQLNQSTRLISDCVRYLKHRARIFQPFASQAELR